MKKLLCAIFVLAAVYVNAQEVTVFQINAQWNQINNYDTRGLKNCIIKFGYLKNQPKDIQKSITALPVLVIQDKNGRTRMQYIGDISLKIKVSKEELQETINKINEL
jgi:hypothetical protein|tara:strand:+ start:939 stop:1259 length:321 start_codon:yes stop_codon:yes gene_type:complete